MTFHPQYLIRLTVMVAILALNAATGVAQSFTKSHEVQGQFRDAAIDMERGQLFVAVYERNNLWRIDTQTGKIATRINVGEGPVALAQDGEFLACVNSLANSVTLVRLNDLSVAATVNVGEGPSAIAALGDGRFIVANAFSDSLSLIDTRGTVTVSNLAGAPAVPGAIAVTNTHVVVVGRADKQLHCYSLASLAPVKRIYLPESVTHLAAGAGDTVIAAGKTALHLFDISAGTLKRSITVAARGLDASGDTVHVVTGDAYQTYRPDLTLVKSRPLVESATVVVAEGAVLALLDPKAQHLQTHNLNQLRPAVASMPESQPELAPVDTSMVIVEATPAEESETPAEEVTTLAAPPAIDGQQDTPVDTSAAETDEGDKTETESSTPPTQTAKRTISATGTGSAQSNPIAIGGVRAPALGRPSASPLQQLSRGTITEALVRPTEFGTTKGGFKAPDLTKNLENIKFSTAKRDSSAAPTLYSNFHAELGDMKMQADTFTHEKKPIVVHAEGNVLITQQDSSITADVIHYTLNPPKDTAEDAPRTLLEGDGENSGSALDQGHLTLKNAHIVEPTREMTAEHLDYDFRTGKGELTNARGKAGIYYFSADKLHLHGPQTLSGDNVWVTTCDRPNPHYKIRLSDVELMDGEPVAGTNARLQLGKANTPLYLPKWRRGGVGGSPWNVDFDSGRQAGVGYYVNLGQAYEVTPDVALGPRIFATEQEGVGLGADLSYDFMENPAALLYRTKGEAHGLYTTEGRGYVHAYHRYEYSNDLVVRAQVEHWSDKDFYKDFFYDTFRNRSQPRSFVNATYRQPNYIATGTVRIQSHGWFAETEQAPEATYHLLERNIANNLYFTFDTVNGYYNREPRGVDGARSVNTARLTYSWDPLPALAITPFLQLDASVYTRDRRDNDSTGRFGALAGVTAQSRLTRTFGGRWGFSAFRHVMLPSITYSYRPKTNLKAPEIPQFDPLDSDFGRSRVELKLDNVFYGRNAETNEVWQVGRITLYQGNDFWNETRKTEDYEIEIDVRPRPWWGLQLVGERQNTADEDSSLRRFSLARNYPRFYEAIIGYVFGSVNARDFSGRFGDYDRALAQLYYDGTPRNKRISGRVGFSYAKTQDQVFNRDIIYGLGYKLSDKWGFGFEHIYDLERDNLRTQTYEIRRSLHCWETAIRFRDRESGFDIHFDFT
ncbi:MAG: hypothetical protein L3K26_00640, partial [Candidatus Hydrogenedentes bacterium]|nr:hypothetical protein [Candidatus Hydrogenedentota bacterium]